nr:hypothetical protein Iba_chr11cCG10740 [Ipomoea batatas]
MLIRLIMGDLLGHTKGVPHIKAILILVFLGATHQELLILQVLLEDHLPGFKVNKVTKGIIKGLNNSGDRIKDIMVNQVIKAIKEDLANMGIMEINLTHQELQLRHPRGGVWRICFKLFKV